MALSEPEALPLFQRLVVDDVSPDPRPLLIEHASTLSSVENTWDAWECGGSDEKSAAKGSRSGEKLHGCSSCGKRFSSRYNLKRHIEVMHETQRTHACEVCGTRFKHKSHVVEHFRQVHRRDRPFACDLCSLRFATPSNLRRHVQDLHVKSRPFVCNVCARSFSSKYNFDRHMLKVHTASAGDATNEIIRDSDTTLFYLTKPAATTEPIAESRASAANAAFVAREVNVSK
eukprot:CAMPEP_0185856428 /NCGR_PEP_ID=MMETSP1354-20130828/28991_1 /TAXON_ID=708628 /ORGANISM="Erythrolobus madagascarensis, Strain CCMP3276" /LENGTH=229 /DNA_ID=CAMNT_0028558675 /DNA_START=262 /DNA_END=951 /DNA_ORIENTATION=+